MRETDWKVLIIDDEKGVRRVMALTLKDAGYEVLTADSGQRGIRTCQERSPHIVITDILMPEMDGIDVLKKIKEEDPDIEVIVMTGFGELDNAIRALQLDASDYVTKPIHDDAIQVALKRAKERYKNRRALKDYLEKMEKRWIDTADELEKTYRFQKNLIESSIDGIMGWNNKGEVVIFNKRMEKMLGYSKDVVIGKMSFDQFFPKGAIQKFEEVLRGEDWGGGNRLFLYETDLVSITGTDIPVQLSATVLFEEGDEIGTVGFFRDIRETRRLEQQFADQARLLQQDKMITMGRLAASAVHEINNPLSGVLNYIRLMIKILNRDVLESEHIDKFRNYLTLSESETRRCSKIVSNLLTFSRKSEVEFTKIDINELVTKSLLLSQHKLDLLNIQPETVLDPNTPIVLGDSDQIQQCIINLVFNAIDAMPDGGTLNVSTSVNDGKKRIKIEVKDTGCGISKGDIPKVFDPFYTTKSEGKGLGLGLSTVSGIIDRHKGSIRLDSELGEGTIFTIELPLCHGSSLD